MLKHWGLLAILGLALAGCGGSSGGAGGSGKVTVEETEETEQTEDSLTDPTADDKEEDKETVPDAIQDDPDANVVLGWGVGSEHQAAVAHSTITTLTSGGSTSIKVNLVDADNNNAVFTGQRTIAFNSYCAQLGLAEFNPQVVEAAGLATSNYTDKGCGQEDNIIVSLITYGAEHTEETPQINVVSTAVTNIDVKLPVVGVLSFVNAEPPTIALKGNGSEAFPETSLVTFRLLDQNGNPMFSKEVRFEMDHERGGARLARTSAVTNAEGYVDVTLASGRAHGEIRVLAATDIYDEDGNYEGVLENQASTPVTMTTGLPDENSFGLGADVYNPDSWSRSDTEVAVTAMLADINGNPVPDGTGVSFTAESGVVGRSCETVNGRCSVTWRSQAERPIDGIVTIVAKTVGEGNFQDLNSNGMFDVGEPFETFAEPFMDANGSAKIQVDGIAGYDPLGVYNPHVDLDGDGTAEFGWSPTALNSYEVFYDVNENGVADLEPGDKYQGLRCSNEAIAQGHCADMAVLSQSIEIVAAESTTPFIEGPFVETTLGSGVYDDSQPVSCIDVSGLTRNIMWRVSDSRSRRNKLPAETSVRFASDGWIETLSGGNNETISPRYGAALRYDLWKHRQGIAQGTNNNETRYRYLNARGHIYTMGIARDTSFTGRTTEFADHSLTVEKDGAASEVTMRVSALGRMYKYLKTSAGDNASIIDVRGGEQTYRAEVTTPCGQGFEPGTIITFTLNNGETLAADWIESSEGTAAAGGFQSTADQTATIQVSAGNDNQVGGNWVEFRVRGDGTSNLDSLEGLQATVRQGTLLELTETVAAIQD